MPRRPPRLQLQRISTATTYYFRPDPQEYPEHKFGWALATVNDETGEISIQSDWGKWSYQWNPRHLGSPSLTHFIGDIGECDYLADKLWGGYGGRRFCPRATVAALRKKLAERRLEEGRHHLQLADRGWGHGRYGNYIDRLDEGADHFDAKKKRYYEHQSWTGSDGEPLTKGIAREIWDALDELEDIRSEDLFVDRLHHVRGHEWMGEELWNDLESEQDPAYTILLMSILPALRDACAGRVKPAPAAEARV